MRLLFVHERMGAFGGAEANVLLTATELRDRGYEIALAHESTTGLSEAQWTAVFAERFPLRARTSVSAGEALKAAVRTFQPDVIFVHKTADEGVLAALGEGNRPVVRMVHDHDLYCMRGYKYNVFTRKICTRSASLFCVFPCGASLCRNPGGALPVKWVSYFAKRREIELNRKFQRLIVATDYMREELLRNGFDEDKIEIHAPVPRGAPPTDGASFSPINRIVYAGQIIRGKGVDVLLESLALVKEPFECVIIGDGSHRAACERRRDELGLQSRVTFTGFIPQAKIAEYYRDASLSVMSSLWPEPFGATGLEAMRCGLPVVAFDAGGIREWLINGVNGFLVPWMDREAYAARVDALLGDKTMARTLGENGRRLAEERFSFVTYINGLENLFARAAEEPVAAVAYQ